VRLSLRKGHDGPVSGAFLCVCPSEKVMMGRWRAPSCAFVPPKGVGTARQRSSGIWFLRVLKILDCLIGSLRRCCHSLPNLRQGGDLRYTMADIGLSTFSLFFLPSPSRSWRTSVVSRRGRGARIAKRCSVWTRSPATIISGRCWTRSAPPISTQSSPRW
jgi:hypothetical protein